MELLLDSPTITVKSLQDKLHVSSWTIRRDLDHLQTSGVVSRQYGKVTLIDREVTRSAVAASGIETDDLRVAKTAIGEAAARLIRPEQNIVLAGGTTTIEVARALLRRDVHCTVVTNGLVIALELSRSGQIQVTCTGGDVNGSYQTMTGPLVERAIQKHYFDIAIIGVGGIALEEGLTVNSGINATTLALMLQHSKQAVVAADHTKFGVSRFAHLGSLDTVDTVVTDRTPDEAFRSRFLANDIKLIVADPSSI
jgi:DeoR family transcriptional regulator of aga operon